MSPIDLETTSGGRSGRSLYAAPPIIEAVIELRFADRLNSTTFNRVVSKLDKRYSSSKSEQMFEIKVDFQTATPILQNQRPLHRLSSADEADICILKDDTISWSRLPPYEGWNAFQDRVERDLDLIERVARHRRLTRVGVRFMNRIDVPTEGDNAICRYEDYLTVHLKLPDLLEPTNLYHWRVERDFPDLSLKAIVQSAVMPPEIPETGAFLLDIDIGTLLDVPGTRPDMLAKLATMRKLKNDIFEQAITARARQGFR